MQQAKRSTHSSSSSSSSEETKQKKEDMCQLHDVEKMIRIFMESDDNKDGVVTKEELVKNYRKLGLKKEQVDKWMERFDADRDGKVTTPEFCKGIDVKVDAFEKEKHEWTQAVQLKDGVEIIHKTTSPMKTKKITDKFCVLFNDYKDKSDKLSDDRMSRVAVAMKKDLDRLYGKAWQVTVLQGFYAMSFVHEPFRSIQFSYKDAICTAFQSHKVA